MWCRRLKHFNCSECALLNSTKAIFLQINQSVSIPRRKRKGLDEKLPFLNLSHCVAFGKPYTHRDYLLCDLSRRKVLPSRILNLREKAYEYKCDASSRKYQSVVVLCGMLQFLTQSLSSPNSSSVIFRLVSEESQNAVVS